MNNKWAFSFYGAVLAFAIALTGCTHTHERVVERDVPATSSTTVVR